VERPVWWSGRDDGARGRRRRLGRGRMLVVDAAAWLVPGPRRRSCSPRAAAGVWGRWRCPAGGVGTAGVGEEETAAADQAVQEQGGGGEPADDPHCRRAQPPQADERVPRRAPFPHAASLRPTGKNFKFLTDVFI
jgi:hypothetical protein